MKSKSDLEPKTTWMAPELKVSEFAKPLIVPLHLAHSTFEEASRSGAHIRSMILLFI